MVKRGRSKYTEAIAEEICARLAEGESLNAICRDAHMPNETQVRIWALNDAADKAGTGAGFAMRYARARSIGFEKMADELVEIADADCTVDGQPDNALVQQARLRVDTRKWVLSKQLPKKYGDKITQEITGEDGGGLITRIELVAVAPRLRPEPVAKGGQPYQATAAPSDAVAPTVPDMIRLFEAEAGRRLKALEADAEIASVGEASAIPLRRLPARAT